MAFVNNLILFIHILLPGLCAPYSIGVWHDSVSCGTRAIGVSEGGSISSYHWNPDYQEDVSFMTCDSFGPVNLVVKKRVNHQWEEVCSMYNMDGRNCELTCELEEGRYEIDIWIESEQKVAHTLQVSCASDYYTTFGEWEGGDLSNETVQTSSYEECHGYCESVSQCRHWSWEGPAGAEECRLYDSSTNQVENSNTSFVRDSLPPKFRGQQQDFLNCGSVSDSLFALSAYTTCNYMDTWCNQFIDADIVSSFVFQALRSSKSDLLVWTFDPTGAPTRDWDQLREIDFCQALGGCNLGLEEPRFKDELILRFLNIPEELPRGQYRSVVTGTDPGTICVEWTFEVVPLIKDCADLEGYTECGSGECLPTLWFCDSFYDCWDNSDELHELCDDDCMENFQCDSGQCVEANVRCDGHVSCWWDDADERDCV